jgi:hypothetical protein
MRLALGDSQRQSDKMAGNGHHAVEQNTASEALAACSDV